MPGFGSTLPLTPLDDFGSKVHLSLCILHLHTGAEVPSFCTELKGGGGGGGEINAAPVLNKQHHLCDH